MDNNQALPKPFRVGFVLMDGFALMSYAAAMEPLRAANLITGQMLYQIRHITLSGAGAASSSGALIHADCFVGEKWDFDLILIVAGGELIDLDFPEMYDWLQCLALQDVLIGGVSGGPLLLACSGVMHGRRMTVHWEHASRIASLSRELVVERTLYVRDRDRLTCAGGTAALDMMQALIAEQHGAQLAHKISNWFLHSDIRPGEEQQRSGLAERFDVLDPVIIRTLQAMDNHLADPLTLEQLACIAQVSARQLNRLFQQHLQMSTQAFYRQLRLQKAQWLLRSTALPVGVIAQSTGFANGAHLSRLFRTEFGTSPKIYRAVG